MAGALLFNEVQDCLTKKKDVFLGHPFLFYAKLRLKSVAYCCHELSWRNRVDAIVLMNVIV